MLLEDVCQLFNQFWFDLDTRSSSSAICLCQTLDQRLWLMAAISAVSHVTPVDR